MMLKRIHFFISFIIFLLNLGYSDEFSEEPHNNKIFKYKIFPDNEDKISIYGPLEIIHIPTNVTYHLKLIKFQTINFAPMKMESSICKYLGYDKLAEIIETCTNLRSKYEKKNIFSYFFKKYVEFS